MTAFGQCFFSQSFKRAEQPPLQSEKCPHVVYSKVSVTKPNLSVLPSSDEPGMCLFFFISHPHFPLPSQLSVVTIVCLTFDLVFILLTC